MPKSLVGCVSDARSFPDHRHEGGNFPERGLMRTTGVSSTLQPTKFHHHPALAACIFQCDPCGAQQPGTLATAIRRGLAPLVVTRPSTTGPLRSPPKWGYGRTEKISFLQQVMCSMCSSFSQMTVASEWSSALSGIGALPRITSNGTGQSPRSGRCQRSVSGGYRGTSCAIYMTDAEGRLTFYNEAAAELWGCRPDLARASSAVLGSSTGRMARRCRTTSARWRWHCIRGDRSVAWKR